MNKRFLLLLLLGTATAHAQVRFSAGPQLGYTLSTTTYHLFAVADYDTHYRSGFSAGVTAELGLGHLFLRPAVLYTQKGYNQEETRYVNATTNITTTSRTRTDYLTVPLNLGYTWQPDGQGFQLFAGPYLGLLLGGHYTRESAYGSTNTSGSGRMVAEGHTSRFSDDPLRLIDFGLQGGIGYRRQHLLAQLDYSMGLRNADPSDPTVITFYGSSAYHHRVFQLSLAYLFGPKA